MSRCSPIQSISCGEHRPVDILFVVSSRLTSLRTVFTLSDSVSISYYHLLTSPPSPTSPLLLSARAAQLPRLPYIILALAGLVVYDVVSVVGTQQFTDGGASIMEAVARAKAGMPSISTMISVPPEGIAAMASSAMPAVQSLATVAPPAAVAAAAQFLVPSLSTWRPGR
jgi:hypothetical protein